MKLKPVSIYNKKNYKLIFLGKNFIEKHISSEEFKVEPITVEMLRKAKEFKLGKKHNKEMDTLRKKHAKERQTMQKNHITAVEKLAKGKE